MIHWRDIAVICVVCLVVLAAVYAVGFWWWVLPHRHVMEPANVALYGFMETRENRWLHWVYYPVIYLDAGEQVVFIDP